MNGLDAILTMASYISPLHSTFNARVCDVLGPVSSGKRLTLDMLTILSVGRLVAVRFPFNFRRIVTYKTTLFYILLSWVLCSSKFLAPFFTGGEYQPTNSGWCNAIVNITHQQFMVFELMTGVIPLMLSMGTCVGCITATLVILYRRKQRAEMTRNESADRALTTLTLMLICFIVCFGMWLFVETFGAFSELGINTGTFIDGTTPPNQLTLLFYKVMLTGIFVFGPVNAWLMLRGRMGPIVRFVNSRISVSLPYKSL